MVPAAWAAALGIVLAAAPALADPIAALPEAHARDLGPFDAARRAAVWAGLAAVLVSLGLDRLRDRRRRRATAVAAAGLALAIAARLALPGEAAPLHANGHGVWELSDLVADVPGVPSARYGYAWRQVVQVLAAPAGGGADAVLALGVLFGALGAFAAAVAASRAAGRALAGGVALVALAVDPAHRLLSGSESPHGPAFALLLVALALGSRAADPSASDAQRRLSLWGCALAASAGLELGLVTLALAPVAAAWVLICRWRPRPGEGRHALGAGALLALSGALHLYALWPVFAGTQAQRPGAFLPNLPLLVSGGALLRLPTLTPPALLVLAAIGAVALALRRRWRALFGVLAVAALLAPGATAPPACWTDAVRYQGFLHAPLVLLAGAAVLALPRGPRALRAGLAAVLVLAAASPAVLGADDRPPYESAGYLAARDAAPKLPPDVVVRVPPAELGLVLARFPRFLLASERARVWSSDAPEPPGAAARPCYAWLGPPCWFFTRPEQEAGLVDSAPRYGGGPLRPECAALVAGRDGADPGPLAVRLDDVRLREWERHLVPAAQPVLGFVPCGPRAAAER